MAEIQMTKDCEELIKYGHAIMSEGEYYYNLPYWFKKLEDGKYEKLDYIELPEKVKSIIMDAQTY